MQLIPNSNSEDNAPANGGQWLREFNKCHTPAGTPEGGQFCSTGDAGGTAAATEKRPVPIRVKTADEALDHLLQGRVVEVEDYTTVHTLLTKLAAIAADAKKKGEKAPEYDLCKVSVKGTNLFCVERVRSAEHPEGLSRITMPQFTGTPKPGSPADQLPRRKGSTSVDASLAFVDHLEAKGIKVADMEEISAAALRASQRELLGPQVARMMTDTTYDPARDPIFISRDNYVLDGHHRWAAVVGRDAEDGRLGDSLMKVIRIDAPISELLFEAKRWTAAFGILPKAAYKKAGG